MRMTACKVLRPLHAPYLGHRPQHLMRADKVALSVLHSPKLGIPAHLALDVMHGSSETP